MDAPWNLCATEVPNRCAEARRSRLQIELQQNIVYETWIDFYTSLPRGCVELSEPVVAPRTCGESKPSPNPRILTQTQMKAIQAQYTRDTRFIPWFSSLPRLGQVTLLREPQSLGVSFNSYLFSRPLPSSRLEGSTNQIMTIQTS
jgi:hypothetical protein